MSALRIAVVFPGQGSQSVGMGGAFAQAYPVVADLFARAKRVLGYDLLDLIERGPEDVLRETQYSQPAIYTVNYALARAALDVEPVVSAGHSFAELCSLTLAGALEFEDALGLVKERAVAMQAAAERTAGAMSAVLGLDEQRLRAIVAEVRSDGGLVQLANFNGPGHIVISGEAAAVARAGESIAAAGAKRVIPLNVSGAWHSALMRSAQDRYAPYVEAAQVSPPRFTVISNVDAEPYVDVAGIRERLVRSVTGEVLWHATAERLLAQGVDLVVEFGGSAVLSSLIKRLPGAPQVMFAGDPAGIEKIRERTAVGAPR